MRTAWTRALLALGLFAWSQGCVVSVGDDDDDGTGGTFGVSGSGGTGGSSGSAGSSGSGGSSGDGGSSTGGTGGTSSFPAPTCDEEPGDAVDECARCLKQNCCEAWLACDDETCANEELVDVSECVQAIEFATTDDLGMCISMSSAAGDGLVQQNTQELINCAIAPADDDAGTELRCSSECFGSDIYPD